MGFPWLFAPALVAVVVLPNFLRSAIPAGWRPISRITFNDLRVVQGRGVVEIHPHGGRSQQHVDRDPARPRTRNPRAPLQPEVLVPVAAVIDIIAGVINVIVLHHDCGPHCGRRDIHPVARPVHNASGQCCQEQSSRDESGMAGLEEMTFVINGRSVNQKLAGAMGCYPT